MFFEELSQRKPGKIQKNCKVIRKNGIAIPGKKWYCNGNDRGASSQEYIGGRRAVSHWPVKRGSVPKAASNTAELYWAGKLIAAGLSLNCGELSFQIGFLLPAG